ncbi:GNAT family N-acetyltransferase [Burkholderia ubonensis]|uniref:GNAT family N-acetyltransferase n=1 Tax=Burkholderia ubonensis TaxID=101571 RepID=UPI00075F0B19|nr:GNAT family N-acetyltransferase [Burkholderia ubonensis]KVV07425.1 hypothetical protein WK77_16695 [Burkholderia ubonensis]
MTKPPQSVTTKYSAEIVIEVLARHGKDPTSSQVEEIRTRLSDNVTTSDHDDPNAMVMDVARQVLDERPVLVLQLRAKASDALREIKTRFDQNPFNPRQRIVTDGGQQLALLEVSSTPNGGLHISDIMAVEPGKGYGTRALTIVLNIADEHQEEITLTAKAYSPNRRLLDTTHLRDWYGRHGFVVEGGDDIDGFDMIRPPQPQLTLSRAPDEEDPRP